MKLFKLNILCLILLTTNLAQAVCNLPTDEVLTCEEFPSPNIGPKVETVAFPTEILPMPPIIDQNAPGYLDRVKTSMTSALFERADRENYWCQVDIDAGYTPCRFKSIKPHDYYVKIFNAAWDKEHAPVVDNGKTTLVPAVLALRSSLCPEGQFYVTDFPDGKPLCSPYGTKQEAEDGRYSCSIDVFQHTFGLDAEYRKRFNKPYPIYNWWESYTFKSQTGCTDTIFNQGEVCHRNDSYVNSAVDHYHCGLHLFQLRDELQSYIRNPFSTFNVVAGSFSPVKSGFKDGGGKKLWKPIGDPGARCNNPRNRGGAVLFEGSLNGKVGNGMKIYNKNFEQIGSGFFKGNGNPDRPQFCTNKYGAQYGTEPILVCIEVVGVQQCYVVANPSNRED